MRLGLHIGQGGCQTIAEPWVHPRISDAWCQLALEAVFPQANQSSMHVERAESLSGYGVEANSAGRSCIIKTAAPSADAKKAEVARWEARLIPRPPEMTGSVTCSHAISSDLKSMLVILETIDMRMLTVPGC